MMNRSTQRELIKQLLQFSETLPQIDFGADEQKNMALDILETVAGKCRQDFSKAKADEYIDTMQALSQIIQTTDWHQQGRAENIQCNTLCQDIILQLVENLRHEKEIKKDIVFLPYKASMWDSLESVWKAAYEDKEHCNAYVIPIPYADLNPDRSVAAWHCERDQYPKYVPTLDWREIDLEKWHPDIIFIHNPYDNYNRVTSVESRYYSKNLKQFTDNLVYIPYFVTGGKVISDHFCQTPGVLNADYVICESEAIKEAYERNYSVFASVPKGKFLALGSPKYDKFFSSSKEKYPLPDNWKKIVDGKKIVLYNTSLSAQIQNQESVISKLTEVLSFFKERKDIALWWRPHPLMEATFEAMMPQVIAEYRQIKDDYICEGWGIYDDTCDMDRAITWSDAYYGDLSSMVWLYQRTNKPIILQNISWEMAIADSLSPYHFAKKGESIFFCPMCDANLVTLNRKNKTLTCHEVITTDDFCDNRQRYSDVHYLGDDKFLLVPFRGSEFVKYDLAKGKQEIILCSEINPDIVGIKFDGGIRYKDKIFFYGHSFFGIIVYDIKKDCFFCLDESFDMMRRMEITDEWYYDGTVLRNHLLILVRNTHLLIDVDMETLRIVEHRLYNKEVTYDKVSANDKYICLVTKENKIVFWEYETGKKNVVSIKHPQSCLCPPVKIGMSSEYAYIMYIVPRSTMVYRSIKLGTWEEGNLIKLANTEYIQLIQWDERKEMFWLSAQGYKRDYLQYVDMTCGKYDEIYELSNRTINTDIKKESRLGKIHGEKTTGMEKFLKICNNVDPEKRKQEKFVGANIYKYIVG